MTSFTYWLASLCVDSAGVPWASFCFRFGAPPDEKRNTKISIMYWRWKLTNPYDNLTLTLQNLLGHIWQFVLTGSFLWTTALHCYSADQKTCLCLSIQFDEVLFYVHRNCRLIRDGSPGRPPRLSFSSWTLNPACFVTGITWQLGSENLLVLS